MQNRSLRHPRANSEISKLKKKRNQILPNLATLYHSTKKNGWPGWYRWRWWRVLFSKMENSTHPSHVYLLFTHRQFLLTKKKHQDYRLLGHLLCRFMSFIAIHEMPGKQQPPRKSHQPWNHRERFRKKVVWEQNELVVFHHHHHPLRKICCKSNWIHNFPKLRGENSKNISVATQESRGWFSSPNSLKPNGSFVEFNRHFRTTASSIRDPGCITQMEVTNNPLKRSRIKPLYKGVKGKKCPFLFWGNKSLCKCFAQDSHVHACWIFVAFWIFKPTCVWKVTPQPNTTTPSRWNCETNQCHESRTHSKKLFTSKMSPRVTHPSLGN